VSDQAGTAAIVADNVSRTFTVTVRGAGLRDAIRSMLRPVREVREVVRGVSLTVAHGEFVALLGPNGAGKSTFIKMLTGILVPTSGSIRINGRVPHHDRERNAHEIGAVFGQRTQLWWDLPAVESFNILRDIFGIPAADYRRRLAEFDETLTLSEFWHTPVRHLSLGERVRCDLAAALIHDPRTVFLDEPTIGMDVVAKERVREFLRHQVTGRGRTIVLTTHDMAEVAQLCRRLVVINKGQLVFDGTSDQLRSAHRRGVTIRVVFTEAVDRLDISGGRIVEQAGRRATIVADPGVPHHDLVRQLVGRAPVADLRVEEASVEELIADLYRGGLPAPATAVGG
jgi:ABC-2 type transport system ATP-binding protein